MKQTSKKDVLVLVGLERNGPARSKQNREAVAMKETREAHVCGRR